VGLGLQELSEADGELASGLDQGESGARNGSRGSGKLKRFGKDVGRGYGVLNCDIDADAADGRHSVCGVADAEQARSAPLVKMINLHGEKLT